MKITTFIQFRFSWQEVQTFLDDEIINQIKDQTDKANRYPSFSTTDNMLVNKIMALDAIKDGRNLIRGVREELRLEDHDINDSDFYEFRYFNSFKKEAITLKKDPADYYEIEIVCKYCGHLGWKQNKNLEVNGEVIEPIEMTENGEILITQKLKDIFIQEDIQNIDFRKVNNSHAWQLMGKKIVEIDINKNPNIFYKNVCSNCKRPRQIVYENSNGINLFSEPYNIPRIEKTPMLFIERITGDFFYTNLEFGTVGRIPEGAPPIEKLDFSFKTSGPGIIISGKLAKILFSNGVENLVLTPVNIG